MSPGRSYLAASTALGAVAVWASEVAFWVIPGDGAFASLPLMWALYSVAAAAALSAVIWSGVQGWPAAFLGGSLMGVGVEGAVVATMYDAFPVQLIWTPLAWHGLLSGGVVLALLRAGRAWGWALAGLGLALWAQYWLAETGGSLVAPVALGWLLGVGLALPVASAALDRVGVVPVPPRTLLLAAPVLLTLSWMVQTILTLNPLRLAGPAVALGLLWLMRRVAWGQRRHGPGAVPIGRGRSRIAPLITPLVASAFGTALHASALPLAWMNIAVALATGAASLGAIAVLIVRSRPSPAPRRGAGP